MIRRCAVYGCKNTDDTIGHRFPIDKASAQLWKDSLQLQEFPIELLQTKFIVCQKHFKRNDSSDGVYLDTDAVPTLHDKQQTNDNKDLAIKHIQVNDVNSSECASESETTEKVATTTGTANCLHWRNSNAMQNSCHSTSSINSTQYSHDDIYILETHESHYGTSTVGSQYQSDLIQLDAPDFTVLHAVDECSYENLMKGNDTECGFDESTEIILEQSERYDNPCRAISCTDSDVEILLTEEIIDSDWSAGNAAFEEFSTTPDSGREQNVLDKSENNENAFLLCANTTHLLKTESIKFHENTEQDVVHEDLCMQQNNAYDQLTRAQMINVIRRQSAKIRRLEVTLNRYREAQRTLFKHVDVLRSEFNEDEPIVEVDVDRVCSDGDTSKIESHEIINTYKH